MKRTIALLLILNFGLLPALAETLISQESWSRNTEYQGSADAPMVFSPPARLTLSDRTEKLVVLPQDLEIKDEIQEFRLFRNRYVIFGTYLSLALYYNWLTRHR
ncbi:MAG: hypothetical protein JW782_06075 [Candidatus Saganbacteria bacterium]|nr:hypothetical protein [Candidatus Saganbacteria bacterium]